MSKWLDRLQALQGEMLVPNGAKNQKKEFRHQTAPRFPASVPVSPPLDPEGVPCGLCPICNQGEFWRRPKFHKDHDPAGWVCWFCSPPASDKYCADFCGYPTAMEDPNDSATQT